MKNADSKQGHAAEDIASAAGERVKDYVDQGVNALNVVSGKARQLGQAADSSVRNNAWIAIGAAAGVGLVLGYLLRGRRDS